MYTDIAINKITIIIEEIQKCEVKLKREYNRIEESEQVLRRIKEKAMQDLVKKLDRRREDLYVEIQRIQILRISLEKIRVLYRRAEEQILDYEENMIQKQHINIYAKQDLSDLFALLRSNRIIFK